MSSESLKEELQSDSLQRRSHSLSELMSEALKDIECDAREWDGYQKDAHTELRDYCSEANPDW